MLSKKSDYFIKKSKPKAKPEYKCEICNKEYVYLKPLENHYKIVHDLGFRSIKDERFHNEPNIKTEETTIPKGALKPLLGSAPLQLQYSLPYSILRNFVCSKCRLEADNHSLIQKHIERCHKGEGYHVTIRVQCDKCLLAFPTLTDCDKHQWKAHIKDDQVEFPGTCCEFGCMKKYADLGGLTVHHNRHVQQAMESGEQTKESNRKSMPTKVGTTEAQQIFFNINQFNSPHQSTVHNSKANFNIAKQNNVAAIRPTTKYLNYEYNRNRKFIRRDSRSKLCNPRHDFYYRAPFGKQRCTAIPPPKQSTDRDTSRNVMMYHK